MAELTNRVIETAAMLGPRKAIVGIVSQPPRDAGASSDGAQACDKPTVVILNSGIIHRVGANRMSVQIARTLAARGHTAVRFDLAGLGDSERRPESLEPIDAVMLDIREVLDSLESGRGARKFVLMGLCSGANHSIGYAHTDPRVVGVAMFDPTIPRTQGYYVRHGLKRAADLSSWTSMLSGRHRMWKSLGDRLKMDRPPAEDEEPGPITVDDPQVRAWLEAAYGGAVATGVEMLAVFTPGLPSRLNYREQLLEAFPGVPFGEKLQLLYREGTDHEFTLEADRAWLLDAVLNWTANTVFGRTGAPA